MMYHLIPVLVVVAGLIFLFPVNNDNISLQDSNEAAETTSHLSRHKQLIAQLRKHSGVYSDLMTDKHPLHSVFNQEAPIPPQCYTRIEGKFNPCYVCHQNEFEGRENVLNDGGQQLAYNFSDEGLTNHWQNLFEDRSERVAQISDREILDWIDDDNFSNLAQRLRKVEFKGWIPDIENLQLGAEAFDKHGFARDGSNWVAFNYKPLPSSFWPTNGATDDVMIRLPEQFRTTADGQPSADVYRANLAIVEALVKGLNRITSLPVDERKLDVDLNADGKLGMVEKITRVDRYVGAAEKWFADTYLYPEGTEFLHTVRYVGVGPNGEIGVSRRMKEVRYMRKWKGFSKAVYARQYQLEGYEKDMGHLPQYKYLGNNGLDNGYGWSIQGFIENVRGDLRVATYEENLFCMGCHAAIGGTIDKTFSFPRKVDGAAGWGYINLKGMPDAPNMGEQAGEIATYLERVGGGGEFRSNPEMFTRWFNSDDSLAKDRLASARDVYDLITPSVGRALELNKAYRVIVQDQDFIYGRDATVTPPENVYDKVDIDTAPTLPEELFLEWDIRLDWSSVEADWQVGKK